MPGFIGAMAGNDVFSELIAKSGVTVLLPVWGAVKFVGGGESGGLDQENVAAGEALFEDRPRLLAGRDGSIVDEDADDGAFAHELPPSISVPNEAPFSPRTRASKSVSPFPFAASRPSAPPMLPKLMKSLREADTVVALFAPSSWSLRIWSVSMRVETVLMRVM